MSDAAPSCLSGARRSGWVSAAIDLDRRLGQASAPGTLIGPGGGVLRDDVFAFFADPANEANEQRWRTHVKEIWASEPIPVGTHVHQAVKGPGGRGIPADFEVTGYEPGSRYAFRVVAGPVRPVGELRFAPGGNATTVSLSMSADLTGWKKLLLSRSVRVGWPWSSPGRNRAHDPVQGSTRCSLHWSRWGVRPRAWSTRTLPSGGFG